MKNIMFKPESIGFKIGELYQFQNLLGYNKAIYPSLPNKVSLIPNANYDPNLLPSEKIKGYLYHKDVFLILETKEHSKENTDFMYCKILKENISGWILLDLDSISVFNERKNENI